MAYNPNGLQLYRVDANGLHQLWEHITVWGPIDVKWASNKSLLIAKTEEPVDSASSWVRLDLFSIL
jgi:hypothetical protein